MAVQQESYWFISSAIASSVVRSGGDAAQSSRGLSVTARY